ncbi:MAG: hypothetical protein ACI9DC_003605 [Gammaproteobacteria bacterium]|jgi:uncharacterized protein (TIGR00288 family)
MSDEPLIAVYIDYENLALGVRDMNKSELRIELVLKRLLEKGRIVYKRAYCDWSQYRNAVRDLHRNGIEMVDIPRSRMSGKNSADIHMVVDALDMCYSKEHIDYFALLSGDSDFSPLVSKLKENNKWVLGCGVKSSTSDLLIASCDEFIYYDDLERVASKRKPIRKKAEKKPASSGEDAKKTAEDKEDKEDKDIESNREEVVESLVEIIRSLGRDYDPLWGSLVKQTMRRVHPGFNESYYGFKSFSDMLKNVADMGLIELEHDQERGNFKIVLKDD